MLLTSRGVVALVVVILVEMGPAVFSLLGVAEPILLIEPVEEEAVLEIVALAGMALNVPPCHVLWMARTHCLYAI